MLFGVHGALPRTIGTGRFGNAWRGDVGEALKRSALCLMVGWGGSGIGDGSKPWVGVTWSLTW